MRRARKRLVPTCLEPKQQGPKQQGPEQQEPKHRQQELGLLAPELEPVQQQVRVQVLGLHLSCCKQPKQ